MKQLDTGRLVSLAMFALNAVAHNYIAVEQLSKHAFLRALNQRSLLTELAMDVPANEDSRKFDWTMATGV